jgi:amino acid adenylation domain-containing protein
MAEQNEGSAGRTGYEIAVVGMAARLPGADDVGGFWRNLRAGVESVRRFGRDELLRDGVDPHLLDHPDYVPARGHLQGADTFDAALFGMTPRDAEVLDPQHRVLLECAWAALEHAGYDPARTERPIGVFAGSGGSTYARNLEAHPEVVAAVGAMRARLWNDKDQLAAGISYRLNLRGPSLSIQTACSTSLVAVHLACQSLLAGESDLALAGGVSIMTTQRRGYLYSPDGILSPDGRCRAFDAEARGAVGGSGAGLVVLKRLDDALADGDTIHAVIRGSAINNDGAQKVGYTAPSLTGQARVISEALAVAGVDPATVQYVETHGSGTPLGDAIELKALGQVLGRAAGAPPVAIGSVKTGVGHLDAAAGIAGLIKTVLALEHGEIPPSLNCDAPRAELAAAGGRLFVNTTLRPWTRNGAPRRAGVSSFGIGGTNAHAVLEEAPPRQPSGPSRDVQLLVLSARTETALATAAEALAARLEAEPTPLADAAFTLRTGRRELEHRLAVTCRDAAEGAARLREAAERPSSALPRTDRPVAFMFPGVGTHYVDMGRGLYDAEPVYREAVDACCDLLRPVLGSDLRDVLFSGAQASAEGGEGGGWDLRRLLGRETADTAPATPLDETRFAQPAVFVTEYALARLWMSWGVVPRALIGHSLGEYVAACVAEVLRLEDALRLVALRARLIDALPSGAMLAVPLAEAALREILPAALDLAAVNTAESCVVAGPADEVAAFEAALRERGVVHRRLPARHAFHSRAMAPVAAELERLIAGFELRAPEIPFVSNVTGTWIADAEARSPAYWARHLCRTVRFADGVAALRREPGWMLLEVGPGQALGAWALQHPSADAAGEPAAALSSLRHQHNRAPDLRFLLDTLGALWTAGVTVDWTAFSRGERRHRVPLPGYPFERKRYFVEPPRPAQPALTTHSAAPADEKGPHAMENRVAGVDVPPAPPRRDALLGLLREIVAGLTGIGAAQVVTDVDFFQAGLDSLLLLQAIQAIEKRIGVRVPLIELLEEISTLDALAGHLDRVLPADAAIAGLTPPAASAPRAVPAPPALYPPGSANPSAEAIPSYPQHPALPPLGSFPPLAPLGGDSVVERVFAQQMQTMAQLMGQQIAALTGYPASAHPAVPADGSHPSPPAAAPMDVHPSPAAFAAPPATNGSAPHDVPTAPRAKIQPPTFVAYQPLNTEAPAGMTDQQREYLDGFIARFVERTKGSKAHQARYHVPLADTRVTARFRRAWKEITYPIVGRRAAGARVWDVDGNEYVDTGMSFGCNLFGHAPEFVTRAMQEQIERGYGLGPQSEDAGRAAELVCELGGNERAVFCNSGTEAVLGAIRAARAYTGRTKIAYFAGSYHGWSDLVLGRLFVNGDRREVRPSAPGVSPLPLGDVLMLDFDEPASLELLRKHLHEIALVMVEPVQSRRPDLQPFAFLRELRRMTREAGTLLLFDELITGFRMGPGGAQQFFGIDADLVTYGKIVAGGLPMGVVAGKREPMSVFDGGTWQYGDDSYPPAQRTLFAGAFWKHPLSMAVAVSVLGEIQRRGQPMYDRLNERTARLVERMNAFFETGGYPVTVAHFASCFRFFFGPEVKFPDLFNQHLVLEGIYVIPETGTHFLSDAHTDEDLERVFQAVRASAEGMRQGGFIPDPAGGEGKTAGARIDAHPSSLPAPSSNGKGVDEIRRIPVTEGQRQLWIESQMGDDAGRAYVESLSIRLTGVLDAEALRRALQALVDRHDALRVTLAPDGDAQLIHSALRVSLPLTDLREVPAEAREARLQAWMREHAQRAFDLERGPLVRFGLAAVADDEHVLLWDMHHAAVDGWSTGVLWKELDALYTAETEGRSADLPPAPDHAAAVRAQVAAVEDDAEAQAFWRAQFADGVPTLELPTDRPRPAARSWRGGAIDRALGAGLGRRLALAGRAHGLSPYHTVLSAVSLWLWRLTGQDDLVIGTPSAGQAAGGAAAQLVGNALNTLPLRVRVDGGDTFAAHARRVRRAAVAGLQHQHFSFPRLVQALRPALDLRRPPIFSVLVNLDRGPGSGRLGTLRAEARGSSGGGARVELDLNLVEAGDELSVVCDYAADLFDAATVERWLDALERVLEQVAADPAVPLASVEPAMAAGRRPAARTPDVGATRPGTNGASRSGAYLAPRTKTERVLAEIWAGALGRERVGVNDHFFALGGDSIRAIRVATAARRAGVELTPLKIFEHPTLSALAAAIQPAAPEAESDAEVGADDGMRADSESKSETALEPESESKSEAETALEPESESKSEAETALEVQAEGRERPADAETEGDAYPLTPLQEGLLFHALAGDGAQAYQVQTAMLLEGDLDTRAFRRAWETVFERHPALHTAFRWEGVPHPVQRVARGVALPWAEEDWRGRSADEQEALLERRLADDRARGFVLYRAPLMRCALFRVGDGAHWLLWSAHHLLLDGWSTALVMEEVFTLYRAWSTGGSAELPPVRPWRAFVEWLQEQDAAAAERYWRERLAGFSAPTPLAVDRPAGGGAGEAGAHRRVLDEALSRRLDDAARRMGVTLNSVVLGAWGLLLSRYSGDDDVVFGTTVSGRPAELEGVEEMVGMFINTLPLRLRVEGGARLGAWLDEVQRAQAGARAYEYASLAQVQGWSQVPAGTPLFESLFVFQNHPMGAGAVESAGVRIGRVRAVDRDNYPLSVTVIPGARLVLDLAYETGRLDADTAARVLEHLARLLERMAEEGDPRLAELSLVSGDERRAMEEEWRQAERAFPRDACIHHLIAERAAETPDAPAVLHEAGMLTFAELDARANRLAHHLRALGVRPEARVAICVERGPDMTVAILATLKAGGAYVPLDPAYPAERLAWMLEDSRAAVLLTHASAAEKLAVPGTAIVRMDADAEAIGAAPAEAPESGVGPENLAYVIYTSGSTGRPKGVALHHRALVNFAVDMAERLGLKADDRVLQFASPGFDVVVEELFPAWVAGAAVVLPQGGVLWPEALLEVLERQGVTTVELPTAYWHEWVHALVEEGRRLPAALRQVLVGGERILPERLAQWSTLGVPLVHVFGLTETACTSATLRLEAGDAGARWPNLPVGTPCGNVRPYVLDRALHPVPAGVPGELFIGGEGVARGYLGRAALTAERFVPDPFSPVPGARAYRTGDRVRWVEDGSAEDSAGDAPARVLEFIGRLDHQEKIRGFRVEPGEVEAALAALPGVREARVLVRRDPPGDPRLVAYVVGDADGESLHAGASASLPGHMVPSAFVVLERLPLTVHGKLDRAALPAPGITAARSRADQPRDYLEVRLIQLWEQVLGVEGIGATQSFFSVGGNSLLALRLFTRVNRVLECDLPLSTLLSGATVRQMAAAIEAQRRAPAALASIVALQPEGSLPPVFMVHASDRTVMGYVNLVRHLGMDQPAFGIRDVGDDAARPLARIAADHVAAMRAVQPHGPYHLLGWSFGGLVVFEMALQLQRAGERAAFVGFMDTMAPELYRAWPWDSEADLVINLAGDIAARARRPFTLRAEDLEGLDVDEQVRRAMAELEAEDALPERFDADALMEQCRLVRDRDRSFADYAPARLHGTVTLFRAEVGSEHLPEFLEGYPPHERRTYAWCRHADEVEVRDVPGEHGNLGSEPQVRVLAREMRAALAAAHARAAAAPEPAADDPAAEPEGVLA